VPLALSTPVRFVQRVGDRVAAGLAERGIVTVEDLLYHLPFRYEDRLHPRPLAAYRPGDMASLVGEVRGTVLLRTRSMPIFEMTVGITPPASPSDPGAPGPASGTWASTDASLAGLLQPPPVCETVKCLWFHGTYLKDKFRPGQRLALYGKLEASRSGDSLHAPPGSTKFKMIQPTFEVLPDEAATGDDAEFTMLEMGRIVPVYESLGGKTPWGAKLTSRWLRRVMWTIFKDLAESTATELGAPSVTAASSRVGPHDAHPGREQPSHSASALWAHDTLPTALRHRLQLPRRLDALRDLHFPPASTSIEELAAARTPAHRRLIFEELFYLELGLQLKRRRLRDRPAPAFVTGPQVREALKQVLPFKPTAAQKRVLGEIVDDLRRPHPMRRLLQGDVGSGKTIVALQAALVAIENGFQVALMAPTTILATQHFLAARRLLHGKRSPRTGQPYRVALLTGTLDDRAKREVRNRIRRGEVELAIGTHALVEDNVDFDNLGLVIMDEQHRFGVQQRFQLMRKPSAGENLGAPSVTAASSRVGPHDPGPAGEPHTLVMTATPIPRTLALTIYGDLEASVIDELPPGRTPILTRRIAADRAATAWELVRRQVAAGHQAYIVYPMVEGDRDDHPELDFAAEASDPAEAPGGPSFADLAKGAVSGKARPVSPALRKKPSQRQPLRSATEMFDQLRGNELKGLRLGLLHGRMSADDKDVTMARFQRGDLDVLVATTVIEVGVDVPNATVMVIEHADRFGLAQLHQLRGRVGRGAAASSCLLVESETLTPEAEQRLDAMVQHQDGFTLAEIDLALRGPGEFFGTRQAGLPAFRVASLTRDRDLLELAKREAAAFVEQPDPALARPEIDAVWARLKQQWQRRYGLVEA
jgi:ATP-dependent DNA helicase RecG